MISAQRLLCVLGVVVITVQLAVAGGPESSGPTAPRDSLVVPARQTILQVAFDVARLRPVQLFSYAIDSKHRFVGLFAWDEGRTAWIRVSALHDSGRRIVFVGADNDVSPESVGIVGYSDTLIKVDPNGLVEFLNRLDGLFKFTPREWGWLAQRYKLQTRDLNEERRKYGRFGKPGVESSQTLPSNSALDGVEQKSVPSPLLEASPEVVNVPASTAVSGEPQNGAPVADPVAGASTVDPELQLIQEATKPSESLMPVSTGEVQKVEEIIPANK